MVNYKKELKSAIWDDFERGIISEEIMTDYFNLFKASNTQEFYRGLYHAYNIFGLRYGNLQLNIELMEG